MWVSQQDKKGEAKMLRPSELPRGPLKIGKLRPRKHRDVSAAKAQILRLINQENTHSTQNVLGHKPLEKGEASANSDRVSNIARLATGEPMGRAWKDERIKAALFYLSPRHPIYH